MTSMTPPTESPSVAEVFDTEWTRLVAILVRDLRDVGAAEDAAQDAFAEAARRWPTGGTPDRPGAWLLTTARRKAIDRLRRTRRLDELLPLIDAGAADRRSATAEDDPESVADEALDEQLALLVGCCHPALGADAQVALTLRIVGGLSTSQIARAFFVTEQTMTRRLTRAKEKIRLAGIPFEPPDMATLEVRLPVVRGVIYSIFTEGHASATATELVRGDLCDEALWLGELLDRLVPDDPENGGLLALMLLTDARRSTRVDDAGLPVLLAEQDRSKWDRRSVARGLATLSRAQAAGNVGIYQLQAAIAALHATAPTFEQTDWDAIVRIYDAMLVREPTAIIAMNRAIAIGEARGPAAALDALDAITGIESLDDYPYLHSARGELLRRLGRHTDARASLERALDASRNDAERRHLKRRIAEMAEQGAGAPEPRGSWAPPV
jgi:RNA polymerase sigma-70 factor (ECF subfamily)